MADQIGPNLVCGDDLCVLRRGASCFVRCDGECGQVFGVDVRYIVLCDASTWQLSYPTPTPRRLPRRHRPSFVSHRSPVRIGAQNAECYTAVPEIYSVDLR